MFIVIVLILAIMIAQIGFWDTFGATLGGVAMIVLLAVLGIALLALLARAALRRARR